MTRAKPVTVNAAHNESILKVLPGLPVLSSQAASWNGIQLAHHRHLAAFETPEHCFPQHFITIHLNHVSVKKERMVNGELQYERFRAGDICLTPATAPVAVRLYDACEIIHLYLEPTLMARLTTDVANVDGLELMPQFKLNDPLIYQIGIALKTKLETAGVWDRLYTESMAMAISAQLIQHYSTQPLKVRNYSNGLPQMQLQHAIDYIQAHAAQNPSITEIAQWIGMSPFYFSRLFKQSTGLTPHQYLIQYRVEQAKQLLKTTNLSVATVATQVGFVDQSHLARHFKRQVGVPPSQFRA
jgi:AraC family transcriptional regulator